MFTIVLESVDKCGKSTIIRALHKRTNYRYPILDRFTGSSISYGKHNNRKLDYNLYKELEKSMFSKVLLFYITADKKDIINRMKEHNEKDITISEIDSLKKEYEKYLKDFTFFDYRIVNTSKMNLKESVNYIVNEIKKKENETGIDQVKFLTKLIEKRGHEINGTKELTNINFDFNDIFKEAIRQYQKENSLNNTKYEKLYYDRIYYSLRHIINSQLKEYNQLITSRRFIFTSNECINSFHLLFRNNVLEVFVTIRSSNVKDILPLDIYFSYRIAEKLNREFFNSKVIKINFKIHSAHVYVK